jgi:hypothetical protein
MANSGGTDLDPERGGGQRGRAHLVVEYSYALRRRDQSGLGQGRDDLANPSVVQRAQAFSR